MPLIVAVSGLVVAVTTGSAVRKRATRGLSCILMIVIEEMEYIGMNDWEAERHIYISRGLIAEDPAKAPSFYYCQRFVVLG